MSSVYKVLFLLIVAVFINSCKEKTSSNQSEHVPEIESNHPILGKWIRMGPKGPICYQFFDNGTLEVDFGRDDVIDVVSEYKIHEDSLIIQDIRGQICSEPAIYRYDLKKGYLALDVKKDNCNWRVKNSMAFWTRTDFKARLAEIDQMLSGSQDFELILEKARIYLAIGELASARNGFDQFLKQDSTNARVYLNRAGTRFPNNMNAVINDCDKAIELDPNLKNAYFLKGLALYELGENEQACEYFSKAIDLGFTVLEYAERNKCASFWR